MGKTVSNPLLPLNLELYIADGEPYVFDGSLYLYGSTDIRNGFENGHYDWCSRVYHVVHTNDMAAWEDAGISFSLDRIPGKYLHESVTRLWAPDILYNPKDGIYYLFICTNSYGGIFVATSRSPKGPFEDPKPLTIDGKGNLSKGVDPGVLMDDDGKAYIVWPDFDNNGMCVAEMDPDDFTSILGSTITSIEGLVHPFEGPSLRKRGDTYYFIYIQNNGPLAKGNIQPSKMAYMTAKSPLGPYKYQGLIIDTSNYPGAVNVHGSIVEMKGEWYVFYHMPVQGMNYTRFACAAPLGFYNDGTIIQAKPVSCGPRAAFVLGEEIPAISAVEFSGGWNEQRLDFTDPNDAFLFFLKPSSHAGFRYMDFGENDCSYVNITLKSTARGILEVRADEGDGQLLTEIHFDVSDKYVTYSIELKTQISHRHAFYLVARELGVEGRLLVSTISFT